MLSKLGITTPTQWSQPIDRSISFTFAPKQYNNELLKSFFPSSAAPEHNNTDLVLENTLYKYYFDKQTSRNELLTDMSNDYLRTIDRKEALLVANGSSEQNLLKKLDECYKEREQYMDRMQKKCADLTKELGEKQKEVAELKSFSNMTKSDMAKFKRLKALLDEYKAAVNTANVHEEREKLAKVVLKYNKLIQYFDKLFKKMKQQIATGKHESVFICTESGIIARQDADLYKLHAELNLSQYRMEKLRSEHENEIGELRLKHISEVKDVRKEHDEHLQDAERKHNDKLRMMEKRLKELENENGRCKNALSQKDEEIGKLNNTIQQLDQTVLDFNGIKERLDRAISDREAWEQTCRKINKKCQHLMKNGSLSSVNLNGNVNDCKVGTVISEKDLHKENGEEVKETDSELMKIHLESNISVQNELREEVKFLQTENNRATAKLKQSADNEEMLNQKIASLQKELTQLKEQRSRDLDLSDEYIAMFRNTPGYDLDMQDGRLVYSGGLEKNDSGIFGGLDDDDEEEVEDALMVGQRFSSL